MLRPTHSVSSTHRTAPSDRYTQKPHECGIGKLHCPRNLKERPSSGPLLHGRAYAAASGPAGTCRRACRLRSSQCQRGLPLTSWAAEDAASRLRLPSQPSRAHSARARWLKGRGAAGSRDPRRVWIRPGASMLPSPKGRAVRLGYGRASESPIDDGVRSLLRGTPEYPPNRSAEHHFLELPVPAQPLPASVRLKSRLGG